MEDTSILYDIIIPQASVPDDFPLLEANIQSFECAATLIENPAPKRKPSWSDSEQDILLEEVAKRESKLFGKFKGSGRGKKERGEAWEEVAKAVNEIGVYLRTGKEAAKQYANLKSRAKEKISQFKRPKTGGGPKPSSPTPVERTLLDSLEGRPSLQGLSEGFDTGDMESECEQPDAVTQSVTTSSHAKSHGHVHGSVKQKSLLSLQKEVLQLEKRKMEKEIEVLDLRKEKLRDEISYLKLKKREINALTVVHVY